MLQTVMVGGPTTLEENLTFLCIKIYSSSPLLLKVTTMTIPRLSSIHQFRINP